MAEKMTENLTCFEIKVKVMAKVGIKAIVIENEDT